MSQRRPRGVRTGQFAGAEVMVIDMSGIEDPGVRDILFGLGGIAAENGADVRFLKHVRPPGTPRSVASVDDFREYATRVRGSGKASFGSRVYGKLALLCHEQIKRGQQPLVRFGQHPPIDRDDQSVKIGYWGWETVSDLDVWSLDELVQQTERTITDRGGDDAARKQVIGEIGFGFGVETYEFLRGFTEEALAPYRALGAAGITAGNNGE